MTRIQTSYGRNHCKASLVPAAAVIPATIAYTKIVAVEKLVADDERGGVML
jgi:hypothetical protein